LDLKKLLEEGARLAAAKPRTEAPTVGAEIQRIKRDHLDWEHYDALNPTEDDTRALRQDLLEAGVALLQAAARLDVPAKRAA
jgi:hypothetical protein